MSLLKIGSLQKIIRSTVFELTLAFSIILQGLNTKQLLIKSIIGVKLP